MLTRRHFLYTLPALTLAPRLMAQSSAPLFNVRGLSQMTLTVSDVKRSLAFYQGLFGMPIQARQGSTLFLRIGDGPQFLALKQAAAGERPSMSGFGVAVENFSLDRAVKALEARGVKRIATDRSNDLWVADPGGVPLQIHDKAFCGGGTSGTECRTVEPSPTKGIMAVRDMSHFTIFGGDAAATVKFYQDLFGAPIQAYQGAAPAYGIGPGVHFLMFAGGGPGRGGAGRGGAAAAPAAPAAAPAAPAGSRIDHGCMSMNGFDPKVVTKLLVDYGLKELPNQSREPLVTYISLRMPNRGGAEGGTPELYLTDPDGLAIQLQDVTYCGGAGFLGEVCPPL